MPAISRFYFLTAICFLIAGILIGYIFIQRQKKLKDPLVDLNLFSGESSFGVLLSMNLLAVFTTFGCYVFISQYLQLVLGLTPLVAGLWTLPWSIGFIVGSMLTPKIANHFRRTTIMASGLILAAMGFVVLAKADTLGLVAIVGSSVLFSFGLAPLFTLITDMILSAVPPERAGAAGALSETSSEFGGAVGIALLGSIGTAVYRLNIQKTIPPTLTSEDTEAVKSTIGGALTVAEKLEGNLGDVIVAVSKTAFTNSLTVMAIISALLSVMLAVLVLYRFRGKAQ